MILDVGNCRARHLFAHVERAVWKDLGFPLYGWVAQDVPSETEEEDEVATAQRVKEEAATGPKAFLGGRQTWTPGPVAEPVQKKLRGSAATVAVVGFTYPRGGCGYGPRGRGLVRGSSPRMTLVKTCDRFGCRLRFRLRLKTTI